MKRISLIGLLIIMILQSCAPSNSVSGGFIQKRKYTKGFHIARRGHLNSKQTRDQLDDNAHRHSDQTEVRLIKNQPLPGEHDLIEEKTSGIPDRKTDGITFEKKRKKGDRIREVVQSGIESGHQHDYPEQKIERENKQEKVESASSTRRTDEVTEALDSIRLRSKIIRG